MEKAKCRSENGFYSLLFYRSNCMAVSAFDYLRDFLRHTYANTHTHIFRTAESATRQVGTTGDSLRTEKSPAQVTQKKQKREYHQQKLIITISRENFKLYLMCWCARCPLHYISISILRKCLQ